MQSKPLSKTVCKNNLGNGRPADFSFSRQCSCFKVAVGFMLNAAASKVVSQKLSTSNVSVVVEKSHLSQPLRK